jgi:nucleoside-diphosphate-sugar epimerase
MPNPLEGKTVLVTGGTGFIGTHLVRRLRAVPGIRLVLLSRRPAVEKAHQRTERISCDVSAACTTVACDCQRLSAEVWRSSGVAAVDYVFHLAGEIPKNAAALMPSQLYETNVAATAALLASLPSTPQRFLFASTVDIYAPLRPGEVLSEASTVAPRDAYGASKVECENVLTTAAAARGFCPVILRYGHIYGPGEQAYRKLIPEVIRRLLQGEPPVVYGDGSAERDYLYVGDAVEATIRAAAVELAPDGPVNIVRGESYPIRRIVETIARIGNFTAPIRYILERPDGHSLRFTNRKMRAVLSEWPFVPLEDGLCREFADFQRLPG